MSIQVGKEHYLSEKYASLDRFISYFHQLDLIRKLGPATVLFVGVGDAMISELLRKQWKVTTLDIDPALSPDVVGDIRALPFPDESYDLVCAFEVLEHLPFEEAATALKELARVSRSDVLISVPHRRTGFELVLKFPFIRSLVRANYLRFAFLFPVRFPGFAVSGQHYWEIDGRTTKLKDVRAVLRRTFTIREERTPVLDFYHRFFVLRKLP